MKKNTRTIEQTIYTAEDGTIFTDELECAMYEKQNPYNEQISKMKTLKNIMFFNQNISGFWCENEEDVNNCCEWFMTNYKNIGIRVLAVGKFFNDDYYFFISDNNDIDKQSLPTYLLSPVSILIHQWDLFLTQLPAYKVNNIPVPESENKTIVDDVEVLRTSILNEFLSSKEIQQQLTDFTQQKIQSLKINKNIEKNVNE